MTDTLQPVPNWLDWARQIQSLAQTGLAFASNDYEIERNTKLIELASQITAELTTQPLDNIKPALMGQPGYATPKVDVRSVVIREGRILLVKEAQDQRWALPGGWADVGDKPSEVAERETREESGYEVSAKKVIGVFDANRSGRPLEFFHAFKIIFMCKFLGGEARTSNETLAVDFYPLDNLPELSQNRTNMKHINEIIEHINDPGRAAYFD